MIPTKLKQGDEVRVLAPARSLAIISKEQRLISSERFKKMGIQITFGKHVEECDEFKSSSIESRIKDLHDAFEQKTVKGIITVIGGFNSNQLLRYLNYDLIRSNPKIFCGYSDITALQNAIYCKTGLITYSGPHYSTFAMQQGFDFSMEYFDRCLFNSEAIELTASAEWSDDPWYIDQNNRSFIKNEGYVVIQAGEAEGTIVGGHLGSFRLLQGTEYMPSLKNSVLFIESDEMAGSFSDVEFDRNLQSLIHQPDFNGVRAIVVGRFQKKSEMNPFKLRQIISTKKELAGLPIVYGMDFGHTAPQITFPIGGSVRVIAGERATVTLLRH